MNTLPIMLLSIKCHLLGMLVSVSVLLSAQQIETPKTSSALILKDFDPNELNGDGWAFQPRLEITAPATFILQNHPVSISDLPREIIKYALLCPPHKRCIMLRVNDKVPASTLILFLQALQNANSHLPLSGDHTSSIPITAIIPIDRSTHKPTFPIPLPKPQLTESLPPAP